ncbi:Sua5/YciO/YrdC/YwlC family protein [Porticoccaceae bacterium]|nr:Sua5/YciO/YrdC/YwlC family protein [Porticoccaceae bacterium]MDB9843904.1 Sua5/YciO/YrdC/YwlC family protein [Porticoccaceae bacterium]
MIDWNNHPTICSAVETMQGNGVVAYPTEAVWGLGCDPASEAAVHKILQLKGRDVSRGLILIADHIDRFAPFLQGLDKDHLQRFESGYHKPTTWLVPHNGAAPLWIVGEHQTVALRVTVHPLAAALCKSFAGPIVSTSANPQGLPAATTALKVDSYFGDAIDYQTLGAVGDNENASEIRHLLTGQVVRPG